MVEADVTATVYAVLKRAPGGALMTEEWRQSNTLRIVRRDPYEIDSAKILPLHVLAPPDGDSDRTEALPP